MTFLAGIMTYIWPFSSSEGGYIVIAILYGFVFAFPVSDLTDH